MLGALSAGDRHFDAYWFRTSDQYELDLVLDFGQEFWAVEVKLTTSPGPADMIGAARRFLVSQVAKVTGSRDRMSCDLPWLLSHVRQ